MKPSLYLLSLTMILNLSISGTSAAASTSTASDAVTSAAETTTSDASTTPAVQKVDCVETGKKVFGEPGFYMVGISRETTKEELQKILQTIWESPNLEVVSNYANPVTVMFLLKPIVDPSTKANNRAPFRSKNTLQQDIDFLYSFYPKVMIRCDNPQENITQEYN